MTVDDELTAHQTARRNGKGQYLVVPPGATKPTGYSRATTWAKVLEDQTNLKDWAMRTAVDGIRLKPSLLDGDTPLRTLADQAFVAGGGHDRRNLGTDIHAAFERYAKTGELPLDPELSHDALHILHAIDAAGFQVLTQYIEFMVVLDRYKIAGTCDLVLRRRSDGQMFIADLKTGSTVSYGGLSFSIQLAIYAQADNVYSQGVEDDGSDDVRLPMPDVDGDRAIIIHYDRDAGTAFHWADIAEGYKALETCQAVRTWRNQGRRMLTQFDGDGATSDATGAVEAVGTVERTDSRPRRPTTNPHIFTPEAPGPGKVRTPKPKPTVTPIKAISDTDTGKHDVLAARDDTVADTDRVARCVAAATSDDLKPIVMAWAAEAKTAGVMWNPNRQQPPRVGEVAITEAAIALAELYDASDGPDTAADLVRAVLAVALGDDVFWYPVGASIGLLTVKQASAVAAVAALQPSVVYDEYDRPTLKETA